MAFGQQEQSVSFVCREVSTCLRPTLARYSGKYVFLQEARLLADRPGVLPPLTIPFEATVPRSFCPSRCTTWQVRYPPFFVFN